MQRKNTTQANKSNGHAIPLAQIQRMPKAIQNIAANRQIKLCRLLDKAPSRNTPQKHKKTIPNTKHHIRNAEAGTTTT